METLKTKFLFFCLLTLSVGILSCDYSFHKMKDDADDKPEEEVSAVLYIVSGNSSVVKCNIVNDELSLQEEYEISNGITNIEVHAGSRLYAINDKSVNMYNINEESSDLHYNESLDISSVIDSDYRINSAISPNGNILFLCNEHNLIVADLMSDGMTNLRTPVTYSDTDNYPLVHHNSYYLYVHKASNVVKSSVSDDNSIVYLDSTVFGVFITNPIMRHDQKTVYGIIKNNALYNFFAYRVENNGSVIKPLSSESGAGCYSLGTGELYSRDLHPNGTFLYIASSDTVSGYIKIYSVNSDGSINPTEISTVKTLKSIRHIKVIPGEISYLVASCTTDDALVLWQIEDNGTLRHHDRINTISKPSNIKYL